MISEMEIETIKYGSIKTFRLKAIYMHMLCGASSHSKYKEEDYIVVKEGNSYFNYPTALVLEVIEHYGHRD